MFTLSSLKTQFSRLFAVFLWMQLNACSSSEERNSPVGNVGVNAADEVVNDEEQIAFFKTLESRKDREVMGIQGMVFAMTEIDERKQRETSYEFDELGNITKQTTLFNTGKTYSEGEEKTEEWKFDEQGLPLRCDVYFQDKLAHSYTYSYDFLARKKTTSYYASDGSFLSKTVYAFDEQGNMISSIEENVMGARTREVFEFNDRNVKVSELRIDENQGDTLLELSYAYEYDAAHNWTKRMAISSTDTTSFLRTYHYQ